MLDEKNFKILLLNSLYYTKKGITKENIDVEIVYRSNLIKNDILKNQYSKISYCIP